ncbi:DNA recombination protein RmuC [Pseudoglutamicibacter albus]|uniref:DNA recombination protein RmuC n=1 Tax=Pseudoglutamicibacter albus TaxID=98671 RepID=UPI00068FF93A|nr:DNA recombination protein RmuC [Pseudoglutamicibacter albus]
MEAISIILAVLALIIGLVLGAFAALRWGPGSAERGEIERLRSTVDQLRSGLEQAHEAESRARAEAAGALGRANVLERTQAEYEAQKAEQENTENQILRTLAPMTTKLHELGITVNSMEKQRNRHDATLQEQLRHLIEHDQKLLTTTTALAGALKDTSKRGSWGEIQLRRIVELAGMTRHVDFTEQASVRSRDEAPGGRPDMVVHLPGKGNIAVDAKAPFPDAETFSDQREYELTTAKVLEDRIKELSKRSYQTVLEGSPDVVVCFVPAESMLSRALDVRPQLLDTAFANNVVLASPNTLLAILKGLAVSWRQHQLTDNANALYKEAKTLHERIGIVLRHFNEHGKALNHSVESYNRILSSMNVRLLPSLRRIQELDPAIGPTNAENNLAALDASANPTPHVND